MIKFYVNEYNSKGYWYLSIVISLLGKVWLLVQNIFGLSLKK